MKRPLTPETIQWLQKIYPGVRYNVNVRLKKQSWEKLMGNYIIHKEKYPTGLTTYTRHGFIPMEGHTMTDGIRDKSLAGYMTTLKEYSIWEKSLPLNVVFTVTKEKHQQRIEDAYRAKQE